MNITKLRLINFRNIRNLSVDFDSKVNVIIGQNGHGKTNLLESIYFAVYGKSFRPIQSYLDLIFKGSYKSSIHIERKDGSLQDVKIYPDGGIYHKEVFFMNEKVRNIEIYSKYPVILFAPNSLDLIIDDPRGRREDLDTYLSICIKDYAVLYRRYINTLKNRNKVIKAIKENRTGMKELEFWNEKLITEGSEILDMRIKFFDKLNSFRKDIFDKVIKHPSFANNEFVIKYKSSVTANDKSEYAEILREKLLSNRYKEISAGTTLYGVHKDDYVFYLGNKDLRFIGSRGQQRVSAFILKVIQLIYLQDLNKVQPTFLVDDILSELDCTNKKILLDIIQSLNVQVVITSPEELDQKFSKEFKLIRFLN